MSRSPDLEIFLVAPPGFEPELLAEARARGFKGPKAISGGVIIHGDWKDAWRANLELRGPARVLVRIGAFRAAHLAELDKRARAFPWRETLRPDVPVRIEAACRKSRIYHSGAAAERIARAIGEELGAPMSDAADVVVKARIENDLCTLSIDSSGETLHKRGHKEAVAKAPMRENLAALFLRRLGFDGTMPLLDPMCGSGTFVIEAAEMACGLNPGRSRSFAFESLATFDKARWDKMRGTAEPRLPAVRFHGSDRDAGAISASRANARRAGVDHVTHFERRAISDVTPPEGPAGLVIINPPYGTRIGDRTPLFALYGAMGKTLLSRFHGWRVGLITTDAALARSTGLPFERPSPPVLHGGLRVTLFETNPLP